jgi:hemerythrin
MQHLVWSHELDTHVAVIDAQHQRIVGYINALLDAEQHQDRQMIGRVIDGLVDYTLSHFAFEESLMEQAGYVFLAAHKQAHERFTKKIAGFVERFRAGEDVAAELQDMLARWLVNHIKDEDGDYAETVRYSMGRLRGQGGWLSRALKRFFA